MPHSYEQAAQRLSQSGFRMTRTRELLLRLVLEAHDPFSVKMLYERAEQTGEPIHLATVHRNLADFVSVGLLDELPGDENRLFALHAENESGAHVYCIDCHLMRPLKDSEGETYMALSRALVAQGFDTSSVRMMVSVHCKNHHTPVVGESDAGPCEK